MNKYSQSEDFSHYLYSMDEPNLTMEYKGGELANGLERYSGMIQCSVLRHIPKHILALAKKERAPGFAKNKKVFWDQLQPWLLENYERLANEGENTESLKDQKLQEEIIKLRNENKAKDRKYIVRKVVLKKVCEIRDKWSEVLRQTLEQELPPKCAKLEEQEIRIITKRICDDLLQRFAKPISEWTACTDMKDVPEEETAENDDRNGA